MRADIKKSFSLTQGMNVDLVLKDVHMVAGHPQRLGKWAAIAGEEIGKLRGAI